MNKLCNSPVLNKFSFDIVTFQYNQAFTHNYLNTESPFLAYPREWHESSGFRFRKMVPYILFTADFCHFPL